MGMISHWNGKDKVQIAVSRGGVCVLANLMEGLVRTSSDPWPPPPVVQKLRASGRFCGATEEDDAVARRHLGYYCDLQSFNSEDAVTWSFFGTLAASPASYRNQVVQNLVARLKLPPVRGDAHVWLWWRLVHPEKPEAKGRGPEIDFGIQTEQMLLLGEAKWNSPVGAKQGVNRDVDQIGMRARWFRRFPNLTPRYPVICLVGRTLKSFSAIPEMVEGISVRRLTWRDMVDCHAGSLGQELKRYLEWRETYTGKGRTETEREA
ncbi:MAG: hypothetical protein V1809_00115 [Planctomycetota bacterium]